MKDAKAARAVDVSVPSWELKTVDSGSGESAPKSYDLWQAQRTGTGSVSITVDQAAAPQTLVVVAQDGQQLESVTMSVSDGGWFTRAVLLTITGLVLVALAGAGGGIGAGFVAGATTYATLCCLAVVAAVALLAFVPRRKSA